MLRNCYEASATPRSALRRTWLRGTLGSDAELRPPGDSDARGGGRVFRAAFLPRPGSDRTKDRGPRLDDPSPRLVFAWLYVGCVVASFGVFLLTILSLLVQDTLELGNAGLGIAFASLSVGGFTSPFIAGMLADRTGPRPISLAGLACVLGGSLLSAWSPAPWALVAGVFLLGAGFSMYNVMAYAWINEALGPAKGAYLGVYVTGIVAGSALAGLSVALLLPLVPTWRVYFLATAVLAAVPAAALGTLLPRRMGVPEARKDIRAALRHRDVRWVAGLQYLIGLGGAGFSWIPLFLVEARALELQVAVAIFVGASLTWGISGVFFGRLADRGWSKPLIVFGGFGTGFAYLAFVLWGFVPGAVAALLLYAFLWPAGGQVPMTFLGQRLGSAAQRTELGLLENMFLAGDATGAVLIGFLSGPWTLTWALALIPGAVTFLAGGLFAWQYGIARSGRPAARDSPD